MFKKNDTLRNVLLAWLACVALIFAGCNQAVDDGNYVELNDGNPVTAAYATDYIIHAGGGTIKAVISNEELDGTSGKAVLGALVEAIRGNPNVEVELDLSNVWFDDKGTAVTDVFGAKVEKETTGDEGARKIEATNRGKIGADSGAGTTYAADPGNKISFAGLKNLKKIALPFTIELIGANAFAGCENLEEVTINFFFTADVDKNKKWASEYMFDDVYYLTCIDDGAFDGCKNLRTFIITSDIDNEDGQGSATDEAFPISLAKIGKYAFKNCVSLENIRFLASRNGGDVYMGGHEQASDEAVHAANRKANSAESWYTIDGVKRNRVNDKSVDGVTSPIATTTAQLALTIAEGAFQNCSKVEVLDLTNKVALNADGTTPNAVSVKAFDGCTSLSTIYLNTFAVATEKTFADGDLAFDGTKRGVGFAGYNVGVDSTVPGTDGLINLAGAIAKTFAPVAVFNDYCFQYTALNNAVVTDLFHVKDHKYDTDSKPVATDADVVTKIGRRAFFGDSALEGRVMIPGTVTVANLGMGAFANTGIEYIEVHTGHTDLYSITPEELANPTTGKTPNKYWVGALVDNKTATPTDGPKVIHFWKVLNEEIEGNLGYLPFEESQNPNTKVLGEALTTIDADAFYNNVNVAKIVLPKTITGTAPATLGSYAFANAESLEYVEYDNKSEDWVKVMTADADGKVAVGAFTNTPAVEVITTDGKGKLNK